MHVIPTSREKGLKDCHEQIDFQRDFTEDVAKDADYGCSLDVAALFHTWEGHKYENILTYRDQSFASIFPGSPRPSTTPPSWRPSTTRWRPTSRSRSE